VTVSDYTRGEDFDGAKLVVSHLGDEGQSSVIEGGEWAAKLPDDGIVTVPWLQALYAQQHRN
jgi:hypothetical protein